MIGQLSTTQALQLIRYRSSSVSGRDSEAAVFRLQLMKSTMLVWRFAIIKQYTALSNCHTTDTRHVTVTSVDGDAKPAGNRK